MPGQQNSYNQKKCNMKNIYFYLACFALLISCLVGCGDNTDIWGEHQLTPEEIDELARQDSIREAQRNSINADLILEYEAEIIILANGYDGTFVYIDTVRIAELFGITPTQLAHGINNMRSGWDQYPNAPEITGFCIEGTTHADNMTAYNTNSCWGHWWDTNGNTTSWGDNARVFAEYDTDGGYFNVGQMPGLLEAGKKVKFIECLKYNEKRVAVVITVIPKERGDVTATIVNTQEINLTVVPNNEYHIFPVQFDLNKALSNLGVSSLSDANFIGVKSNGSYEQETNADSGFWYDKDGYVGSWGENASVWISYGLTDDDDCLGVGQMPNQMDAGDVVTVRFGFLANNKIEMMKITVTVEEYEDPETAPEGEPQNIEESLVFNKPYDTTYNSVETDVKDLLRNAFKMTTYQIYSALAKGDLNVYLQEVDEENLSYTGGSEGEYWMNSDGVASSYADGVLYIGLYASETSLTIGGGNHPSNCSPNGQVVHTKMIITCKGVKVTFNITYNVTEEVTG